MSTKRGIMAEENEKLIKIYQSQKNLTIEEVIEKYASDEFKAEIERVKREDDEF